VVDPAYVVPGDGDERVSDRRGPVLDCDEGLVVLLPIVRARKLDVLPSCEGAI
jgi:hypothetical protein